MSKLPVGPESAYAPDEQRLGCIHHIEESEETPDRTHSDPLFVHFFNGTVCALLYPDVPMSLSSTLDANLFPNHGSNKYE